MTAVRHRSVPAECPRNRAAEFDASRFYFVRARQEWLNPLPPTSIKGLHPSPILAKEGLEEINEKPCR